MRRIVAMLATATMVLGGQVGLSPQASAATWVYPAASFTVDDGYGATLAIDVRNLRVADGGAAGGYVRLAWGRYSCTQQFSGLTATFFASGSEPCSGTVTFAIDAGSGALTAEANLLITSRLFSGAATTTAQGTKWELTSCTATSAGSPTSAVISWTDSVSGATGYEITAVPPLSQAVIAAGSPVTVSGLEAGTAHTFTVTSTSQGAAPPPCSTNELWTAPAGPVIEGMPVTVPVGGLMTVNYSLPDPTGVQGIEYQIDGGRWLRPGGVPPVNGAGGSFTLAGLTTKDLTVTLRTVGDVAGGPLTTSGTPAQVSFAKTPTAKPSSSGTATGSPNAAPVPALPAAPVSSVAGTSNGAGSGANGALAASTGDAGIDAPCLAADGTLYPNQYSTVGSQLTMAPNTRGLGRPTSFIVVGGALAPGMQLDRTAGVLFGVTTAPGSYVTTVKAAFANGSTKTGQFTTRVDADPQTLQYAAQNIGVVGRATTIPPTTNAPEVGTAYRLVCGVLPAGLRFNPGTGVITGRPTQPVALPTPLRVAETSPSGSAAASFIVVVARAGVSSFSYPAHPHVRSGKRVAIRPTITGARDLVIFRTSKGKLPKGLRINKRTGTITGRPAHAGRVHSVTIVAVTRGGALLSAPPMRIRVRR